jgi:hypothetical protein
MALLLLLGLLANLTVMGSVEPLGMVPLSSWIALSASRRWSKRMKPTPFDRPAPETNRQIIHSLDTNKSDCWGLILSLAAIRLSTSIRTGRYESRCCPQTSTIGILKGAGMVMHHISIRKCQHFV